MEVELIDFMGRDLSVVNAARVSFSKKHSVFDKDKDTKLIKYLARNNHWTPFGHCFATFYIKAPVFVARQLVKHQVGLVWNEVSRRYVDETPDFYIPYEWRGKASDKKQGSSDEKIEGAEKAYEHYINIAKRLYSYLLNLGVAPEQARLVLPVSHETEWYWSGSLAAWARVCNLRIDDHAQEETRKVVEEIESYCLGIWPVSFAALRGKDEIRTD